MYHPKTKRVDGAASDMEKQNAGQENSGNQAKMLKESQL